MKTAWNSTYDNAQASIRHISGKSGLLAGGDWYVYIFGGLDWSDIELLVETEGLALVDHGRCSKGWFGLLSLFVPSHFALCKIDEPTSIDGVYQSIAGRGMMGAYFVPSAQIPSFRRAAKNYCSNEQNQFEHVLESHPEHFYYLVDTDNREVQSGFYEIVSLGDAVPEELSRYFLSHGR